MTRSAWAQSGRRAASGKAPRPEGSWGAAIERAKRSYVSLTGDTPNHGVAHNYWSGAAAATILATALGLWADTAASMAEGEPDAHDYHGG